MSRRIAVVEREKCNPIGCGGYLCMRFCPVNRAGQDCIVKGEDTKINIDEGLCNGCGICVKKCPFDAIHIINLPEDLVDKPIHQYGWNGFHLFNLPVPVFGKVVGIVGRNGIGKSTAIRILAGELRPNMGGDKEADIKALIDFFKGSEAQRYFELLRDGMIKVAYKPQAVDLIGKKAQGKVGELLGKVDEKNALKETVEALDISNLMDNDISTLSGGELQRVAIAATSLKKANVYIFDEPMSYLDIRQRINVARFIKGLANEDTALLVVEHDLIILDHVADLINIMYGKPGVYGIVSRPKSARQGINIYLEGYLSDDNMRFRSKAINFPEKPPVHARATPQMVGWQQLSAQFGRFRLKAATGELQKHKAIGVLGENGIGKTSFVKILAGVEKQKTGTITGTARVSYKPQYLSSDSSELVANVLRDAISKYEINIVRPLELTPLMTRQLNELSGGELQRVSIAACLAREADIYLLDEPSAYLDVEQRLVLARLIRDFMEQKGKTALIVDHDLLFIDYISDNLMVFDGIPGEHGEVRGPFQMEEGMNLFLKALSITLRRDQDSHRPRINKLGSVKDREQKSSGKYYYG